MGSGLLANPFFPMFFHFRKKAERGKIYFTTLKTKENISTMINPKPCGHLCCCAIKGCEEVQMRRGQALAKRQGYYELESGGVRVGVAFHFQS